MIIEDRDLLQYLGICWGLLLRCPVLLVGTLSLSTATTRRLLQQCSIPPKADTTVEDFFSEVPLPQSFTNSWKVKKHLENQNT